MNLEVRTFKAVVPIRRRLRFKYWWMRKKLRWRHGQEALDLMDRIGAEIERQFLFGDEA